MSSTFRGKQTFEVREQDVNLELIRAVSADSTRYEIFVEAGQLKFRKKGSVNVAVVDDGLFIGGSYKASLIADSSAITATGSVDFDKSLTLPAGTLNSLGAQIRILAGGWCSTSATPGPQFISLKFNDIGLLGYSMGLPVSVTNNEWWIRQDFVVRAIGVSGLIWPSGGMWFMNGVGFGGPFSNTILGTNLTLGTVIEVASSLTNSGNSFTLKYLTLLFEKANLVTS